MRGEQSEAISHFVSQLAAYLTTYHDKLRWQSAAKTVHEGATKKQTTELFVHSCNIRGRFAITPKVSDHVITSSSAVFRQ